LKGERKLFPLMADVSGATCVVVGGGSVGWRRASALLECGANVIVVSPAAVPALAAAAEQGRLTWLRRAFRSGDLDGAALAFAATNDAATNERVVREAKRLGIWMNAANDAALGNLVVPSTVRRGRLVMAVTTGGASPKLALRIAKEWSDSYGPEYGAYVDVLERLRRLILASGAAEDRKLKCLGTLLELDALERLRDGMSADAVAERLWETIRERLGT